MANTNGSRPVLTPEERALRAKKLKRKKTIRIAIVITGFILALGIIVSPVFLLMAFRVKNFTVEGVSPYTNEEIISASGLELGKSLIFANLDKASENIEKVLPYTDNVKLSKKLPSTIIIRFDETARAFAIEVSTGMYAITNSNLKVLELSGVVPDDVAVIKGVAPIESNVGETVSFATDDETDLSFELISKIASAITENELKGINYIDISNRSDLFMIYEDRIVLRLGDSMDVESKISLGNRVIREENTIDPSQYGTVDLTIPKKAYFNPSDFEDMEVLVNYMNSYKSEGPQIQETTENESEEEITEEEKTSQNIE